MEEHHKKDIHLLGMEDGYELGKLLPESGLTSWIVIKKFIKEKTDDYRLGLMKGIEVRKEELIKSRKDLFSKGRPTEKLLASIQGKQEPDHDLEL